VKFEWDPAKSANNEAKHGISLEAAAALWKGPVISIPSNRPGELRQLAIGRIEGSSWTVIFTPRGDKLRLISARRSRENENTIFKEFLG
jgi:hypothetical protein